MVWILPYDPLRVWDAQLTHDLNGASFGFPSKTPLPVFQNGYFIKNLDAIRKTTKTPVILITGYELDTESIDYKKEGVDFILKKPVEFKELEKLISDLIIDADRK